MTNNGINKGCYYERSQEVWDAAKCAKAANRTATDSLGTPYPFKGYIESTTGYPCISYGQHRYNGGCIRNDEWYEGEIIPLPKVSAGFEIIHVPTWGYRIIRKQKA
jgi:hypothetical protein